VLSKALVDWEKDLPGAWRIILDGIQLNFEDRSFDRPTHPGEIIIPRRKRIAAPDLSQNAHIFRALEGIDPQDVRAVILGQDPYPNPAWATGRAFEQGNLSEWPENPKSIAASLRRIVQVPAAARTGKAAYVSNDGGWKQLIRDMQDGMLDLEPPRKLFDHLSDEGVLLLNTSLTLAWIRKREDRSGVAGTFACGSLCFTASSRSSLRDGRIMLCSCFGESMQTASLSAAAFAPPLHRLAPGEPGLESFARRIPQPSHSQGQVFYACPIHFPAPINC